MNTHHSFDSLLRSTQTKSPETLRPQDIDRLVKAAGSHLTNDQAERIAQLLAAHPNQHQLLYAILGRMEFAATLRRGDIPLRRALWTLVAGCFTSSRPTDSGAGPTIAWLRSQCELPADGSPVADDRLRSVCLVLITLHRDPEMFLRCLTEIGPLLKRATQPTRVHPAKHRLGRVGPPITRIAADLFDVGRPVRPKYAKVADTAATVQALLEHFREQQATATLATATAARLQLQLDEQRRTTDGLERARAELATSNAALTGELASLRQQLDDWKHIHAKVVDHTGSATAQARRSVVQGLQSKIKPRTRDARLYANRAVPAIDQVLRLLDEIDTSLNLEDNAP